MRWKKLNIKRMAGASTVRENHEKITTSTASFAAPKKAQSQNVAVIMIFNIRWTTARFWMVLAGLALITSITARKVCHAVQIKVIEPRTIRF